VTSNQVWSVRSCSSAASDYSHSFEIVSPRLVGQLIADVFRSDDEFRQGERGLAEGLGAGDARSWLKPLL
jgi:hypothetical protein